MATRVAVQSRVRGSAAHDGFLRHHNFRWAKIAGMLSAVALLVYLLADVSPRPSGGTWYGYATGTLSALMILWLTMLGVRKRAMTRGRWSLKAWTSAHVYLGLSLIVVATLHTAFDFGWNVHTLAYMLMMVVILSGLFGIGVYSSLPRILSNNREEATESQMLEALRSADRQLHDAAQPLDQHHAEMVRMSLEQDPFGGGLWARLTGRYPGCATRAAQAEIRRETAYRPKLGDDPLEKIDALLEKKEAILMRVRRHLRIKALLEIWLYVHVPMTFALIAALAAHIVSEFFYW
ncbi:MAG: hypothetical protein H0X36_01350 [Sphingomonadaceae bacterium]|nr:hypothetical protein [Sphingomonadaceae bacterium]